MFTKFISSLVILFVGYNLFVFISPKEADEFADFVGILSYNHTVRSLKSQIDGTSETLLEMKDATEIIGSAKETIDKTKQTINEVETVINTKVDQVNQVAESVKETKESIDKLRNNIDNLTNFSGSVSATGSSSGNTNTITN